MSKNICKKLLIIACIQMTFFNGISSPQSSIEDKHQSAEQSSKKSYETIIFDLGEVLVTKSSFKQTQTLLPIVSQHPTLIYKLMTTDIKEEIFTMLEQVPSKTANQTLQMYNNSKPMPQIMVDWMTGISGNEEILQTVKDFIDNNEIYSYGEKKIFYTVSEIIFQADKLVDCLQVIKPMLSIAQTLKQEGYKLYILSNWDHQSFPLMQEKYPELFELFDGAMISGTEQTGKPDPAFYQKLLDTYQIDPEKSIFIDDEPHNIAASSNLGIQGIICSSTESVKKELEQLKVLPS